MLPFLPASLPVPFKSGLRRTISTFTEGDGELPPAVHQVVKTPQGALLSDSEVVHRFTMRGGLIAAMELEQEGQQAKPSAAFALHKP